MHHCQENLAKYPFIKGLTEMNISKTDFFYALLSLDSYNRHNDRGNRKLSTLDNEELTKSIGDAIFQESSDRLENDDETVLLGSQGVGFSASYYTIKNDVEGSQQDDQTLIAYRGTDFDFSSPSGVLEFIKDVGAGWLGSFNAINPETIALPDANETEIDLQPVYAQRFYELVTGNTIFPTLEEGEQPSDVVLTGHSLGGSLAGHIGSLTGNQTTIFNEIPYLGISITSAINNFINQNLDNGVEAVVGALEQVLLGEEPNFGGFSYTPFILPQADTITSFRMTGEVAAGARALGPLLGTLVSLYVSRFTKKLQDRNSVEVDENGNPELEVDLDLVTQLIAAVYGIQAGPNSTVEEISSFVGLPNEFSDIFNTVNLHSQSLMTIDLFGRANNHTDWRSIGTERFDALFDESIANLNGANDFGGYVGGAEKMQIALAYSGLEGENLVFGDAGIRSLFNDLDQLGGVFDEEQDDTRNPFLENDSIFVEPDPADSSGLPFITLKQALSNIAVQYAGALALNKVAKQDVLDNEDLGFDPTQGVFA